MLFYLLRIYCEVFEPIDLQKIYKEAEKNMKKMDEPKISTVYINPETLAPKSESKSASETKSSSAECKSKSVESKSISQTKSKALESKSIPTESEWLFGKESKSFSSIKESASSVISSISLSATSKSQVESASSVNIPLLVSKPESATRKPGETYCSTVVLDAKPEKVLIGIKTITMIESVIKESKESSTKKISSTVSESLSKKESSKSIDKTTKSEPTFLSSVIDKVGDFIVDKKSEASSFIPSSSILHSSSAIIHSSSIMPSITSLSSISEKVSKTLLSSVPEKVTSLSSKASSASSSLLKSEIIQSNASKVMSFTSSIISEFKSAIKSSARSTIIHTVTLSKSKEEASPKKDNINVELGLLRKIQKYASDEDDMKVPEDSKEKKKDPSVTDLIAVLKELPDKEKGDKVYIDGDFVAKGDKDKRNFRFEGWISNS